MSEFNLSALKDRYKQRVPFIDDLGRSFELRRLTPAEQIKLRGLVGSGVEDSYTFNVAVLTASICKTGETNVTFPRNRPELDAIMNLLDDEGLTAAAKAQPKLYPERVKAEEDEESEAGNDQQVPVAPS